MVNAWKVSPLFATITAFPFGVLMSARPTALNGARKPLLVGGTGVTVTDATTAQAFDSKVITMGGSSC
jgi:hypothetical protein